MHFIAESAKYWGGSGSGSSSLGEQRSGGGELNEDFIQFGLTLPHCTVCNKRLKTLTFFCLINLGIESEILKPLIDFFYTGRISITNENVIGLLASASQLLLPNLVQACGQFLADFCLDEENCLRILGLATSQNFAGNLGWLETEAMRYIQLHFESIWQRPEFIGQLTSEENALNEADEEKCPVLDWMQLTKLLSADDLCVDSEENVYNCILRWLMSSR